MVFEKKGIVYELNTRTKTGVVKYADSKLLEGVILPYVNDCEIVEIAARAFFHCEKLKKISIPTTVKKIKNEAFAYCVNLKDINGGGLYVENIGQKAFLYCSSLELLNLYEVKTIGKEAFSHCFNLKQAILPKEGLFVIEEDVFLNCYSLISLKFHECITTLKSCAKGCNNLKAVMILNPKIDIVSFIKDIEKNVLLIGYDGSTTHQMLYYGYQVKLVNNNFDKIKGM